MWALYLIRIISSVMASGGTAAIDSILSFRPKSITEENEKKKKKTLSAN
jgi:hypothetical protein